jgi:hypothetical protein
MSKHTIDGYELRDEQAAALSRELRALRAAKTQRESGEVYIDRANSTYSYLRTSRGIERLRRGPDGNDFGSRVVRAGDSL